MALVPMATVKTPNNMISTLTIGVGDETESIQLAAFSYFLKTSKGSEKNTVIVFSFLMTAF